MIFQKGFHVKNKILAHVVLLKNLCQILRICLFIQEKSYNMNENLKICKNINTNIKLEGNIRYIYWEKFYLTSKSAKISSSSIFKVSEKVLRFFCNFGSFSSSFSPSEEMLTLISFKCSGVLLPLSTWVAGRVWRCFSTCFKDMLLLKVYQAVLF